MQPMLLVQISKSSNLPFLNFIFALKIQLSGRRTLELSGGATRTCRVSAADVHAIR
jgi:hypothetical protein